MRRAMKKEVMDEAGFGLVELSISLLVIGLIIAGVLKGRDLLENAKLKTVLTQINEYRLATNTFLDKYDALPGDYDKASQHIQANLHNGNGDGTIEGAGLASSSEALSYWQHLAAANLIASPGAAPSGGSARFGQGAPKSKIGGGFTVVHNPFGDGHHWFVLGTAHGNKGEGALLTPEQALSLDQATDSGRPQEGRVRAKDGVDVAAGSCVSANNAYNTRNKEKACVMYFQM